MNCQTRARTNKPKKQFDIPQFVLSVLSVLSVVSVSVSSGISISSGSITLYSEPPAPVTLIELLRSGTNRAFKFSLSAALHVTPSLSLALRLGDLQDVSLAVEPGHLVGEHVHDGSLVQL